MNPAATFDRVFATTRWSIVFSAAHRESNSSDQALEELCRGYWYPVYVFLRRSGVMAHDAEDLTQAFFERVLSKDYLRGVDPSKGRFRCFLLAMARHFLANHRRDSRAQKRGGGLQFIDLDAESLDTLELSAAAVDASAEKSYDRQWALTLLEQVIAMLKAEYHESGKGELFERLQGSLVGQRNASRYAELAIAHRTTEAALKMTVNRMRKRYGELLRAAIARTVASPEDIEDELRALLAALD